MKSQRAWFLIKWVKKNQLKDPSREIRRLSLGTQRDRLLTHLTQMIDWMNNECQWFNQDLDWIGMEWMRRSPLLDFFVPWCLTLRSVRSLSVVVFQKSKLKSSWRGSSYSARRQIQIKIVVTAKRLDNLLMKIDYFCRSHVKVLNLSNLFLPPSRRADWCKRLVHFIKNCFISSCSSFI